MNYILFGASTLGYQAYKELSVKHEILCFCDNDVNKWDKEFCGLKVIPPSRLHEFPNAKIIITSSFKNAIALQLIKIGISNFYSYPSFIFKTKESEQLVLEDVINISFRQVEIKYYLPDYYYDYIQKKIYCSGKPYESELLENLNLFNLEGKTIIDVGANIGNHALFFAKICNADKVYCFEPNPNVCQILDINLHLNFLTEKVKVFPIALGNSNYNGIIQLLDPTNKGTGKVVENKNGQIKVSTLDMVLKNESMDIGLIKVDVEGMELDVLQGAQNTIRKYKPIISVEAIKETDFFKITAFLDEFNYYPVAKHLYTYIFLSGDRRYYDASFRKKFKRN